MRPKELVPMKPEIMKVEIYYLKHSYTPSFVIAHYASGHVSDFCANCVPKTVFNFYKDRLFFWRRGEAYDVKVYEVDHEINT